MMEEEEEEEEEEEFIQNRIRARHNSRRDGINTLSRNAGFDEEEEEEEECHLTIRNAACQA